MNLFISDANILIDMEAGGLMDTLFRLPMRFAIPDLLYYEEIEPGRPGLENKGLQVMEVRGEFVAYARQLSEQYASLFAAKNGFRPSHNDYLALALAKQEVGVLLTGDANLRIVADKEGVSVKGSIWLLEIMVKHCLLAADDALNALTRMKADGRRLPWGQAENMLKALR